MGKYRLRIYRVAFAILWTGLLTWSVWHRTMLRLLLIYLVFCGLAWMCQRQLTYRSSHDVQPPSYYGLLDTGVARLTTADGIEIEAWTHAAQPGHRTVVFYHGNAGSLANRVPLLRTLVDHGFGFVAIDYRGFGNSDGGPSEQGFYADGRAAMRFATEAMNVPVSNVVIMGESIGTGVAVQMALENEASALFLQSPYTSLPDVAAGGPFFWLPVRLLMEDRFDTLSKIGNVRMPVMVIHGNRDSTIPVAHGHLVFEAAREPKAALFLPEVGHNDFDVRDVVIQLDGFLEKFGLGPQQTPDVRIWSR